MGLDRLLMVRKGIPDIRLLRSADPRVAGQLADLAPWRPVSARPPVRRDLNLLVRVVLRHLERTLTNEEANRMRDRVYAALHQGSTPVGGPIAIEDPTAPSTFA